MMRALLSERLTQLSWDVNNFVKMKKRKALKIKWSSKLNNILNSLKLNKIYLNIYIYYNVLYNCQLNLLCFVMPFVSNNYKTFSIQIYLIGDIVFNVYNLNTMIKNVILLAAITSV